MRLTLLAASAAFAAIGAVANAATYAFSYELSSGTLLAGTFEGDLQGDGDTITVRSFGPLTFGGAPAPDLPFVEAISEFFGGPAAVPVLSLSGATGDLIACTSSACIDGFLFDTVGALGSGAVYNSGTAFGATFETYDPARWSVSVVSTVPLPATAPLALLALAGLAATRRRS